MGPVRVQALMTRYPHWGKHSGLGQFLHHLDPEQFHVDRYFASDSDDDFPLRSPRVRDALRRRVRRNGMKWYKLSDLVAETLVLLRCLRRKVDVVHFLDAEHGAQYLPFLKRHIRAPLVATFHQPSSLLPGIVGSRVVEKLDHVSLVSPEQLSYFAELLPPEKISVILHGIDTDFFRPRESTEERESFTCITVGHWLRDFEAIRKVASQLRDRTDVHLRLVSPRVDGLEDAGNVDVRSDLSDEELRTEYQRADALLLPLEDCTANNALLEAIACGLPVISSALESVHAYVPGEEAILVFDNDPDQLTDAILHLKKNPDLRKRMSRAARKRAEELSWASVARSYASIYRKVAAPAS